MLRGFFKIAFRQFWKNKFYSLIHLTGLTLGLATCIVIYMLVSHELTFDKHWDNADRIYRVTTSFSGAFNSVNRGVSTGVSTVVKSEIPSIEVSTRLHTMGGSIDIPAPQDSKKSFGSDDNFAVTGPDFFEIFPNYEWIYGPGSSSLNNPHSIVLTDQTAEKYFGTANADIINEQIHFRDSLVLTVTGLVKKPKANTDLQFDGFISLSTIESSWLRNNTPDNDWGSTNSSAMLFVKLAAGVSENQAERDLSVLKERYAAENPDASWNVSYELQPLRDIHFNSELGIFDFGRPPANKRTLLAVALIGLFLLFIACFNFINLETAKSALRSKEIGVRKVLGSSRVILIRHFIGETFLLTLGAALLSYPLVTMVTPYLQEFLPLGMEISWMHADVLLSLLGLVTIVALLSGFYPAWLTTAISPTVAMRSGGLSGTSGKSRSRGMLRKSLIALQFFIAQLLIVGTLIIWKQTDFAINKDMGFSKDAIVYFQTPWRGSADKRRAFKTQVEQIPGVQFASSFQSPPAFNGWSTSVMEYERDGEMQKVSVHQKRGDTSFMRLFQIGLLAGRNVRPIDTLKQMVINETLAAEIGYENAADAVGNIIQLNDRPWPIVGVAKDFHVLALHKPIPPVAITYSEGSNVGVKIEARKWQDVAAIVNQAKPIWKELWPDAEFRHAFMDETIDKMYASEVRTAKILSAGTFIALFISCLGLLGLVAFLAHRRTKEIGIRKVLGATIPNIVHSLSKDLMTWVLIAIVPASIVGWYLMRKWLEQFAYTIELNSGMFLLAGLCTSVAAGLTVGIQSARAARVNPIESLRSE